MSEHFYCLKCGGEVNNNGKTIVPELLEACKNARNVLAGLVTGDLKEVRADSPALQSLRNAIAKAEGK